MLWFNTLQVEWDRRRFHRVEGVNILSIYLTNLQNSIGAKRSTPYPPGFAVASNEKVSACARDARSDGSGIGPSMHDMMERIDHKNVACTQPSAPQRDIVSAEPTFIADSSQSVLGRRVG